MLDLEFEVILGQVRANSPDLTSIFADSWDNPIYAQELAGALKNNDKLTSLRIRGDGQSGIGREGAAALAKALQNNTTLNTLALDYSDVFDEGAIAFADMLQNHISFRSLELASCHISLIGMNAIANALRSNHSLTSLDLRRNAMDNACAQAFADALEKNFTLVSFDFDQKDIDPGICKKIDTLLKRNQKHQNDIIRNIAHVARDKSANPNSQSNLAKLPSDLLHMVFSSCGIFNQRTTRSLMEHTKALCELRAVKAILNISASEWAARKTPYGRFRFGDPLTPQQIQQPVPVKLQEDSQGEKNDGVKSLNLTA